MSITMDTRDALGHIRGLALIYLVRCAGRPLTRTRAGEILEREYLPRVDPFVVALSHYVDIDQAHIRESVRSLYAEGDAEFYTTEGLNITLGALSRRPLPAYPFMTETGVDEVGLVRPFLDASRNLVHSVLRLRLRKGATPASSGFWLALTQFIALAWSTDSVARQLARTSVLDAVSDVLFHNWDIASRTSDPEILRNAADVLNELRTFPLESTDF
jgi:hypothetical protein